MTNEYYQRVLKVKPLILADRNLTGAINDVFSYLYKRAELPSNILKLGEGSRHKVFGVGKISNPDNGSEIYIAVRLPKDCPYESATPCVIDDVLGSFEYNFLNCTPVPYFAAAVTSSIDLSHRVISRPMGVLLEDISEGKKFQIKDDGVDADTCIRIINGREERIFIDPNFGSHQELGYKYFKDEARIDLP